jgi:dipeptidyl aminopeptidase/acylaminoacyl peptidase
VVTRLARSLPIVFACFAVAAGCSGGGDEPERRTLIAFTKLTPRTGEVWTARADGTGARRLLRGWAPAVSPDGRWIAFHRCSEYVRCDLYVVSTTGGEPRLLARLTNSPEWSPTSERLVAWRTVGSRDSILLSIDPRTGRETELARGLLHTKSVAPSGEEVVYSRGVPADQKFFGAERIDLYVVGIDGGEPRQLTHDGRSDYPVWGPEAIAFARVLPYRGWGRHEIWRIEPNGEGRRSVTGRLPKRLIGSGITGLVPVAWSADGRSLLTELTNEFGAPPYAVDPETGAIRKIGDFGYYSFPAGLSRDGRFVLVVESGLPEGGAREGLLVAPYRGGRPKLVATRAGPASWNR